ncbi:AAA family ATPase [Neomegalonema sp.]|uniref:AAA family ATPase n=1 Tax=Neomegalonema sp. TaxID=2039713 RepID=UPI002619D87B|nr:AAA family ATPase [Neomegalonema sp.]MDD2868852.1 AAA family ATPase [Neomegalonema sp.]
MTESTDLQEPRWMRDLRRFLPLKSQFLLTGNVRDLQFRATGRFASSATLEQSLAAMLRDMGYAAVLSYDPLRGVALADARETTPGRPSSAILSSLGLQGADLGVGPDLLRAVLRRLTFHDGPPLALLVHFASRLSLRADVQTAEEHAFFTEALVLSHKAVARPVGPDRAPRFNVALWIADKEGDLPDWLVVNNPRLRHIPIPPPDRVLRRMIAPSVIRSLPDAQGQTPEALGQAEDALVDGSEGMLLTDLNAIALLARSEGVGVAAISEAVRRYKVGATDDPWRKIERRTVVEGEKRLAERVLGQPHALRHMMDVVKRAALGVGGRSGDRPRGVAFLAGPTGVGKTELAKAVTRMIFGDESAYIRFDMSEFSAEHSAQRLIGAPPGYVGYDVGGELTNAVRERPFSVVLFDEIEKAHPRVLDKFLQVLDDGVLTSGRGDRVYFSETLIVFTSNLGVSGQDAEGRRRALVSPDQPYEAIRAHVRGAIEDYFTLTLNRPEILNRFGENFIVFDFIRPEIASRIFDMLLARVLLETRAAGHSVQIAPGARVALKALCTADLSQGGRGVRNRIEAHLVNPLARALFAREQPGPVRIVDVHWDEVGAHVTLEGVEPPAAPRPPAPEEEAASAPAPFAGLPRIQPRF